MDVARIKLVRNKRLVVVKQMRRDIAVLLQSGQDATARIRTEVNRSDYDNLIGALPYLKVNRKAT